MTLITLGNTTGFTDVRKWKNPYWERKMQTPNEAFQTDSRYRELVRLFKSQHNIESPNRFYEVRIIKQKPSIIFSGGKDYWWDTSGLMDHVFWVFQQPLYDKSETKPYGFYVLEPYECKRISRFLSEKHHINEPEYPGCYVIPTENCVKAWTETVNGYSEHIHHREEVVPTQEQVDKEAQLQEAADDLIAQAYDSPKLIEQFAHIEQGKIQKLVTEVK